MIVYDLKCINDHTFEGWFEDGDAYDQQQSNGQVECPICNTTAVYKVPSTFAIKSSHSAAQPARKHNKQLADIKKIGQQLTEFIESNFDNVGPNFSKEALKIHYGVSEPRNIRGSSTLEEEKTLKEEGIEFIKLPMLVSNDEN